MAAAATDKFKKAARKWVGQIGAGGVADAVVTTIPLAATTNLPTDTGVEIVIDRVDSNGKKTPSLEETVVGVVSGSNIASAVRGVEGTAQAHSAGAVVEVLLTSDMWNDVVDGILVEHAQDGTHSDITSYVTAASTTAAGKVEIAIASEVNTGTDATRAVSPDALAGSNLGVRIIEIPVFGTATDTTTGDGKALFRIPSYLNGMNLVSIAACVYTAGTTGNLDIMVRNVTDSQDMLSTAARIETGEVDTSTSAQPGTINTALDDVATADRIAIDIDAVQTGTAAKGLVVELGFQLP